MKKIIVCVGSVWMEEDLAGQRVFELLQHVLHPGDIQVYQGGLAGLNLLPFLEQGGRVVFVDSVTGHASSSKVIVLNQQQIVQSQCRKHYGHGAGLPYLLAVLPRVCTGIMPREIYLVGIEGQCTPESVQEAARTSLDIAANGTCGHGKEL